MKNLIKKAVKIAKQSYKDNEKCNPNFKLSIKLFEKGASVSIWSATATPQYQNIIKINDTDGKYRGQVLIRRGIVIDWDDVEDELIEEAKFNLK